MEYMFECLIALDEEVQGQFLLRNAQIALAHFYSLAKSIKKNFTDLQKFLSH